VTLTAAPSTGNGVSGWSGCTSSNGTTCSVSLAASKSVAVTFAPSTFVLWELAVGQAAKLLLTRERR
jgi:hypothetical protein